MFPLDNLSRHGLDGDHPRGPRFWVNATGPIRDVLSITQQGMVMPFLPSGEFDDAADVLREVGFVTGMIGPATHVRGLQAAAGLTSAPATLDEDEPQFLLDLDKLVVPDGAGDLIDIADAPIGEIKGWMADYERHTLHTPEGQIAQIVDADYRARCETRSHMVLWHDGRCLSKTGFNAQLRDIVQIGGVYTPPTLRGRGFARRAVALHLTVARAAGVRRATLFSASDMAARAYAGVGFERIGDWTLLLFDGKQATHG